MLQESTLSLLSELLAACIQGEKNIEALRITLCENYDFSPLVFFNLISSNNTISSRDLKVFLAANMLTPNDTEIFMTIKQYSCLQDGRLTIEDFYQIFLPSTNSNLRDRTLARPLIKTHADQTFRGFLNVLVEELKNQQELEKIKEKLYKENNFTVYKAFDALAQGKQLVNEQDFLIFFKT